MTEHIHGFSLVRRQELPEINTTLVEMVHEKSGAQLVWLDNGCENKTFCVGFKTLPEDSTGVFHILEHSVLCGSKKYPVKEPFVELLKSSMNTFLNAMTFNDKTLYPVSSCNEQDFLNLTSVYLDAVFAPAILENPNIFCQEGWHLETGDEPGFKGVVYNEMKGAMSGVDDQIERELMGLLFPDNCYGFNSGGDPACIPDLSYEKFIDTYRRYYHPGNARFFLDGNVPFDRVLEMIDEYLGNCAGKGETFEIPMQAPVSARQVSYYEITPGEAGANKAILTMGKLLCTFEDGVTQFAMQVLCNMLADTNDSPLCKAVLDAGLGEDFVLAVSDGIAQPFVMVQVRNMDDSRSGEARSLIRSFTEELIARGLDRSALEASINRLAFRARQTPEPQGVYRAINAFSAWLYGGKPESYLLNDEVIASVRAMLDNGGFEKLLEKVLVDDSNWVELHMLPSTTVGEEKRRREAARVSAKLEALDAQGRKDLEERCAKLLAWQQTPDSPGQLATLPVLTIDQVGPMPKPTRTVESDCMGVKVLYHPVPTQGVTHVSVYFTMTDRSLSELTAISMLPALLGNLPTAHYSAARLQQEVKTWIGSLNFGFRALSRDNDPGHCRPCLKATMSVLDENLDKAWPLLSEILLHTRFDGKDAIRQIVLQADEEGKQSAIMAGHSMGAMAVQAHYSAEAAVNEAMNGFTSTTWLHGFAKEFDSRIDGFVSLLEDVQRTSVCRGRMTVSVTATREKDVSAFVAALPQGSEAAAAAAYETELPMRMGISIPAQTAFAVKGYHVSRCGMETDGSARVAANILSFEYLWNEIRVQGGAYGAGAQAGRDGMLLSYSYRDPSPDRSLGVYDRMASFLERYAEDGELDKYIISTVASVNPLLSAAQQGAMADERYFAGITEEQLRQRHEKILSTTHETLRLWCGALEAMARDGAVCVVGYPEALARCENLTVFQA